MKTYILIFLLAISAVKNCNAQIQNATKNTSVNEGIRIEHIAIEQDNKPTVFATAFIPGRVKLVNTRELSPDEAIREFGPQFRNIRLVSKLYPDTKLLTLEQLTKKYGISRVLPIYTNGNYVRDDKKLYIIESAIDTVKVEKIDNEMAINIKTINPFPWETAHKQDR